MTLPTILTIVSTAIFFFAERIRPGRPLPRVAGWYVRALAVNFAQLAITLATGQLWPSVFGGPSLFSLSSWAAPALAGFLAWFVGTFFYYWWHRVRHLPGFWRVFPCSWVPESGYAFSSSISLPATASTISWTPLRP